MFQRRLLFQSSALQIEVAESPATIFFFTEFMCVSTELYGKCNVSDSHSLGTWFKSWLESGIFTEVCHGFSPSLQDSAPSHSSPELICSLNLLTSHLTNSLCHTQVAKAL